MRLAVIPARGGSKRILRKNIKSFYGKPLIAWSILAAQESGCFDRVIVSTDDAEIAEIALRYGAEIPFFRPPELSGDHAGTAPVVAHAIRWQQINGDSPAAVCCIYATAPFICGEDIRTGLSMLEGNDCEYVFSVARYVFPIQRAIRINELKRVEMLNPKYFNARSQDLEETFHDAGQFYWGRTSSWLSENPVFFSRSIPLILPHYRVQDIDTPEDWVRAELMFSAMKARVKKNGGQVD